MIKINPMPAQVDPVQLQRLATLAPADVGHVRYWGVVGGLQAIVPNQRVVGSAVTVLAPAFDSALIPHVIGMVRPGDFLIIDRLGDRRHACMGGVVALAAKLAGAVGVAVDGLVSDWDEIRDHDMPVWCAGTTALISKPLAAGGAINVPVVCGGVAVTPGDAVLADSTGICVMPADEIDDMVHAVARRKREAAGRIARLKAGEKLGALNGVSASIERALAAQRERRESPAGR